MVSPLTFDQDKCELDKSSSIHLEKGEMTGRFEFGSTIVLIYESSPDTTQVHVEEGEAVQLGQKIVTTQ